MMTTAKRLCFRFIVFLRLLAFTNFDQDAMKVPIRLGAIRIPIH